MVMMEDEQQRFRISGERTDARRGVYLLPGAFTVGNLLCGFYAVLATLQGGTQRNLTDAARAIGFAIVFDAFDGFVARITRTNTEFGKQFDSLADMVSFGIAPAVLAFAWGVQVMMQAGRRRGAPRAPTGVAGVPGVRDLLRVAAGAVQRARHGAGRAAVFRGHADAGGGGHDRSDGALRAANRLWIGAGRWPGWR